MKTFFQSIVTALLACSFLVCCASASSLPVALECTPGDHVSSQSFNHPISGMFFSSDYVVEECEYDEAFCLIYTDADADMDECEIFVDFASYRLVRECISEGQKLVGTLILNEELSHHDIDVYTFLPELEFEMAEASANF